MEGLIVAQVDDIDVLLSEIREEDEREAREKKLWAAAVEVGNIAPLTVLGIKQLLRVPHRKFENDSDASDEKTESAGERTRDDRERGMVWRSLDFGRQKDLGSSGHRRKVIGIIMRNNPRRAFADGPSAKIEEVWINGRYDLDATSEDIRVEELENRSTDFSSIPGSSLFSDMLARLRRVIHQIASFYQSYDMHPGETRVVFLGEPVYMDTFRMKVMTNDNTANAQASIAVRAILDG